MRYHADAGAIFLLRQTQQIIIEVGITDFDTIRIFNRSNAIGCQRGNCEAHGNAVVEIGIDFCAVK